MDPTTKKADQDVKKKASVNFFCIFGGAVFFGGLLLYFYKSVGISLIHQRFALDPWVVPFEPGMEFFKSFAGKPGEVLSYLESFLFQWYYFNLSGSIVATLITLVASIATYNLLAVFRVRGRYLLCFVPAAAIAVTYNIYDNMLYSFVGVIISIIAAGVYVRVAPKNNYIRLAIFAITFALLYYVTAGYSLMFALLVAIYEGTAGRKIIVALIELLIACIVVYLVGTLGWGIAFKDAMLYELSFGSWVSVLCVKVFYGLCGGIIFVVLVSGLWGRFVSKEKVNGGSHGLLREFILAAVQLVVAIVITVVALHYSVMPTNKIHLTSKYMARHYMWEELIEIGRENPWLHKSLFYNHDHTRALFHTDRLESELFYSPVSVEELLLTTEEIQQTREYYEKAASIMLSLGYANSAERNSYELLEGSGNWPLVLENLAMVNLAKGQDVTASVFLNRLSKDILHGPKASDLLEQMRNDPTFSDNKEIQQLRRVTLIKDDLPRIGTTGDIYHLLLKKNPKNKMAFQYMMAEFLLKEETGKIADNIHRLDDFGYDKLPGYYEEALVIETQRKPKNNIPDKWKPSAEALREGAKFLQLYAIYKKDKAKARAILAAEYGDSYYYYFMLN